MRDTFSQFESGLKISPPSGKAVIDLFDDLYTYFEAREAPLSALRATLPEGVVTSSVGWGRFLLSASNVGAKSFFDFNNKNRDLQR